MYVEKTTNPLDLGSVSKSTKNIRTEYVSSKKQVMTLSKVAVGNSVLTLSPSGPLLDRKNYTSETGVMNRPKSKVYAVSEEKIAKLLSALIGFSLPAPAARAEHEINKKTHDTKRRATPNTENSINNKHDRKPSKNDSLRLTSALEVAMRAALASPQLSSSTDTVLVRAANVDGVRSRNEIQPLDEKPLGHAVMFKCRQCGELIRLSLMKEHKRAEAKKNSLTQDCLKKNKNLAKPVKVKRLEVIDRLVQDVEDRSKIRLSIDRAEFKKSKSSVGSRTYLVKSGSLTGRLDSSGKNASGPSSSNKPGRGPVMDGWAGSSRDERRLDATKQFAINFREEGRMGSHPAHDDYSEEGDI